MAGLQTITLVYNSGSENGKALMNFIRDKLKIINQKLVIEFLDTKYDKNKESAKKMGIKSTPTLIGKGTPLVGNAKIMEFLNYVCKIVVEASRPRPQVAAEESYDMYPSSEDDDEESPCDSTSITKRMAEFNKRRREPIDAEPANPKPALKKRGRPRKNEPAKSVSFGDYGDDGADAKFLRMAGHDDSGELDTPVNDILEDYYNNEADMAGRRKPRKIMKARTSSSEL